MELSGEHRIPASRQAVWDALHDPDLLRECIPGCSELTLGDDGRMAAKVTAKVGPVKANFTGDVVIENEVAPESYTLRGEGKGGVAGFAKGSADVHLAEDGAVTVLTYKANANVGGKLAQLGSRLVDSTAKRYAADFFSCLSAKLGSDVETAAGDAPSAPAGAVPGETVPPAATGVPETPPATTEAPARGNALLLWGAIIAAAVVIGVLLMD